MPPRLLEAPVRFTHRGLKASSGYSGEHGNVLGVGNCCTHSLCSVALGASAPTEVGEGRGHIVAAARLQLVLLFVCCVSWLFLLGCQ